MKKIVTLLIIPFLVLLFSNFANAQSGLSFGEFSKRLLTYFDEDMILDISKGTYNPDRVTIWGWDVGDFSGDGINDVAFTMKINSEKKSIIYLNLFVDIQGYFVKVGEFPIPFLDLPLEVGANIKDGNCYVTQKLGPSNWKMYGYRIVDGALIYKEDFASKKLDYFTEDLKSDYYGLQITERIFENDKGFEKYSRKYFVIPSYNRGRLIFHGFTNSAVIKDIDFVNKGAFFWAGESDSYFELSSAYDEEFIYFQFKVFDDNITFKRCENCSGDFVSLWFDSELMNKEFNRYSIKGKELKVSDKQSTSLYNFQIYPGDFFDLPPFVNAYSNDLVTSLQQIQASQIKVVSNKFDGGYIIKVRIPYEIIGIDPFTFTSDYLKVAFTAEIHDIDNEFRPEEETVIATSQFVSSNPSTYGSLIFVPNNLWYGKCNNIYRQDLYQTLLEYGY
jgi:hypothetical protein